MAFSIAAPRARTLRDAHGCSSMRANISESIEMARGKSQRRGEIKQQVTHLAAWHKAAAYRRRINQQRNRRRNGARGSNGVYPQRMASSAWPVAIGMTISKRVNMAP